MFSEFELPLGFEDCRTRIRIPDSYSSDASWKGRVLRRELSPSYRVAKGSCSCPGCKMRMDGAEAEFV
ncbi:hypothetical protein F2Q70_00026924 [Brassica cretica]|uniref:Uncharacterized protein n=1 Tax=Brassica cretica TaxID=69181 RepID=A0A8S9LIG8_BRACR|nr:hypothetical protein F2Q70_00026924 [Brassica cretica]